MDELSIHPGFEPENNNTPDRTFAELEQEVQEGLARYQAVGAALDEIHSRRLYKPEYPNFRTYLLKRWGISRAHGYRLIAAAQLAAVSPIGDKPKSEYQARKRETEKRAKRMPPVFGTEFRKFNDFVLRCERQMERESFLRLIEEIDRTVNGILYPEKKASVELEEVAA